MHTPAEPKLTDLPDVGTTPATWIKFMQSVREIIQVREGWRGNALDEGVTFRDLINVGILDQVPSGGGAGGAPGIPPWTPDATPPPPPVGIVASSMFRGVLIEWTAPAYPQGHGNKASKVYVAVYGGAGPLPTFAAASYAGEAAGTATMFVHDAAVGDQLHVWVTFLTVDGSEGLPGGGTNGVQVTVDDVQTSDLADLAVTEPKLANDSVSTRTIEDLAVSEQKLADDAASTRVIEDLAVTEPKLADDSVSTRTVLDENITEPKLADGAASTRAIALLAATDAATISGTGATIDVEVVVPSGETWDVLAFGFQTGYVHDTLQELTPGDATLALNVDSQTVSSPASISVLDTSAPYTHEWSFPALSICALAAYTVGTHSIDLTGEAGVDKTLVVLVRKR